MGGDLVTECIVAARAERRRRETPLCKGGRKRKTRWDRDYPEYLKEDFRRWKRKSRWDDDWEEERYRRLDEEERQWEEEMKELDAMFERDQQREWRMLETLFKPLFGEETDPEMIALDRRRMELHRISRHKGGLNEEELQELRLAVKKLIARERDVINANWGLDEGDIRLTDITYVVNAEFRTFDLRDDRLILKADKIGNFSFKSAYNLIREQRGTGFSPLPTCGGSSSSPPVLCRSRLDAPLCLEWVLEDILNPYVSTRDKSDNTAVEHDSKRFLLEDETGRLTDSDANPHRVEVKKRFKNGKYVSMGFGHLEFDSVDTATSVCRVLQRTVLDGHALMLQVVHGKKGERLAKRGEDDKSSTKLIIRNVAFQATEKELRQLFSPFGQIKSLRLPMRLGTTEVLLFAFVQEAKNALEALSNTHLYGRHLVLERAKEGESLEELRARTAAQFEGLANFSKKRKKMDVMDEGNLEFE